MGLFSISNDGKYIRAEVGASLHDRLSFCLSTVQAGDLSIDRTIQRKSYLENLDILTERFVCFRQTHSKEVALVSTPHTSPYDSDGGLTADPNVVIGITVADCLPIVLYDKAGGGFALLHSGWKGTGIVIHALNDMRRRFGSQPRDITALIGPGIGNCCYDVEDERAGLFETYGGAVVVRRGGTSYLDLKEANKNLLTQAGVPEIRVSELCTCCSEYLGSYRREGPETFTRMLAVVGHF
jgi:polyphenol oxidase